MRTFGSHGTAAGELGPTSSGIYLAASGGELFVADRANHRLQVFSVEGALLRTIGQRGERLLDLEIFELRELGNGERRARADRRSARIRGGA